jgi:hypothetical protein
MSRVTQFLHRTLWLAYVILAALAVAFLFLILDRKPPFRVSPMEPIHVQAGQWAFLDVPVWRDDRRKCSATFSRYLFDSDGARFDLGTQQQASAAVIDRLETKTPGRLLVKVLLPPSKDEAHPHGLASGPASLVTSLFYVCNRAQILRPIEVETEIPLWVEK